MHTFTIDSAPAQAGNVRVRVGGALDRSAVYDLRDRLLGLKASDLTLDFSGLERVDDLALSLLAMWLADRNQHALHIRLEGLSTKARNLVSSFGCNRAV